MSGGSEHQRCMAFAGVAFEKMKDLGHAPTPRNYEVWYTYASAVNTPLNQALDEIIANHAAISQEELDELYERFLSPQRLGEEIDSVGSQVMGEIDQIMNFIDGTLDSTTRHSENLADMTAEIDDTRDFNALRAVIGRLAQTAKDIERTNQKFEVHLKESKEEISELQKHLEAVRTEILTDPLTTLSNRKHFDQSLAKAIVDATASSAPLALMMTDIDHFKKFNDMYGHLTGDQVLRLVALSLKNNVKGQDLAARYGGEEFAVILPNTRLGQAATVADQIRRHVMHRELMKRSTGENLGYVTISAGVAELRAGDTPQTLIERADACLYAAKNSGRNRVVCEIDPAAPAPAKVA